MAHTVGEVVAAAMTWAIDGRPESLPPELVDRSPDELAMLAGMVDDFINGRFDPDAQTT